MIGVGIGIPFRKGHGSPEPPVDKFINFNDIAQPYPAFVTLTQDGKRLTWGDKIKVGSTIHFENYVNIMDGVFQLENVYCNGYIEAGSDITVTEDIQFTSSGFWFYSAPIAAYCPKFFNNLALSSLGYLPDVTGHKKHLMLYDMDYVPESGIGKYVMNFTNDYNYLPARATCDVNPHEILITKVGSGGRFLETNAINKSINGYTVEVKGISSLTSGQLRYYYSNTAFVAVTNDGKHDLPAVAQSSTNTFVGWSIQGEPSGSECNITITEQGTDESGLYFDGIKDYGKIFGVTSGAQCLAAKVNWFSSSRVLYDQRIPGNNPSTFAIWLGDNSGDGTAAYAYLGRSSGQTHINNVLNNTQLPSALAGVAHVFSQEVSEVTTNNSQSPVFGCSSQNLYFARFAMYGVVLLGAVPDEHERSAIYEWCNKQ